MAGVELLLIDETLDAAGGPAGAPLEPGVLPPRARPVGAMSGHGSPALREAVWRANQAHRRAGLVTLSFGNASGVDRDRGRDGHQAERRRRTTELRPEDIVAVGLDDGRGRRRDLRPSSDTPTHLALYRRFPEIGGIVHTHSTAATAWAQARRPIPPFGTTHADHFHGAVPVTRLLSDDEVAGDYEAVTGAVIVETLETGGFDPLEMPAVLVASHGPFAWGPDPATAVENAIALEAVAAMASRTLELDPDAGRWPTTCSSGTTAASTGRPPTTGSAGDGRETDLVADVARCTARVTSASRPSRSPTPRPGRGPRPGRRPSGCAAPTSTGIARASIGDAALGAPLDPRPRVQRRDRSTGRGPGSGSSPTRSTRASGASACRAGRVQPVRRRPVRRVRGRPTAPCARSMPWPSHLLHALPDADRPRRSHPPRAARGGVACAGPRPGPGRCPGRRLRLRPDRSPARPAPARSAAPRSSWRRIGWRTASRRRVRWARRDGFVVADGVGRRRRTARRRRRQPVDVAFETGGDDAAADAIAAVRPGGRVVLVGIPDGDRTTFRAAAARRKELTLQLCRRMPARDLSRAIDLVAAGDVDLVGAHHRSLPARRCRRTPSRSLASRRGLKVVVNPTPADGPPRP